MGKYIVQELNRILQELVDKQSMPGGVLIVNKGEEEVYRGAWGFADKARRLPAKFNTLYRLASMSKVVTAIAVMQLVERGVVQLEDQLSQYLPGFSNPMVYSKFVWQSGYYVPDENFPEGLSQDELVEKGLSAPVIPADREITIRDLLCHSSGIGMGILGNAASYATLDPADTLESRVKKWEMLPLDFQPGTETGYSAFIGFDLLGRIVEIVSGLTLEEYFNRNIFDPLGIKDLCFLPNQEQRQRLAKRYFADNDKLYAGADMENEAMDYMMELGMNADFNGYFSGAAGLWGSCEAYNCIAKLLANEGELKGVRILQKETVRAMHVQAAKKHMEPLAVGQAGCVWGLGVIIFEDASKMNAFANPGTFGWSGAFGTYMLVDPSLKLTMTFMTSIINSGGNLSVISNKVEELVFDIWG